jgi:hypothetical protein
MQLVDQRRGTRNPFDVMDVPNPDDQEVLEFASGARLTGAADDENAKAWTASREHDQYGAVSIGSRSSPLIGAQSRPLSSMM